MNQIIVYQTDHSGLLIGETYADESPLEPETYLIPAGCVETAPPDTWSDHQWPRWNGVNWELINKPQITEAVSAEQRLADFLTQNPDVMSLINAK